MFRIAHTEYLYGLILIPVFVLLYWFMEQWKKKALKRFGEKDVIKSLYPDLSNIRPDLKHVLFLIAFVFLVIGIADPQIGSKMEEVKREGVDLIIALDVSNSMLAEDIRPSRLERSKQAIYRLLDKLQNDRIGLIVFAGKAYVQLPVTTDYGAAKLFLSAVNTEMIPTQGTSIAEAVDLAMRSFPGSEKKHKALIVITDGEDHEGAAVETARKAAEEGIVIHTIGMGSASGSPVPVYRNGIMTGYKKDHEGHTVVSKLNEAALIEISSAGKGQFVRASNSDDGLQYLLKEISKMEKKQLGAKMFTEYDDQFQWFLGIALVFLLIEILIPERKSRWADQFNLFGKEGK